MLDGVIHSGLLHAACAACVRGCGSLVLFFFYIYNTTHWMEEPVFQLSHFSGGFILFIAAYLYCTFLLKMIALLIVLLYVARVSSQSVSVFYEVPPGQMQFLDEWCASSNCKASDLFTNWNFTKSTVTGKYLLSPCDNPVDPSGPIWEHLTCFFDETFLGTETAPANITSFSFSNTLPGTGLPLHGTIPNSIVHMNALTTLVISNQMMHGTLPSGIGALTALQVLDVSSNHLHGTLPSDELGRMPELTQLKVNRNFFSGPIPVEITTLTKLVDLKMGKNNFVGGIPASISALTGLTEIMLGENQLVGAIPTSIYTMTQLTRLDLDNNQLSGGLSNLVSNLYNLKLLELSNNKFDGAIPAEIYTMVNLTAFDVAHNSFSGAISSNVGNLVNLQVLSLGSNSLNGVIPASLALLTNLVAFDIAYNDYSGQTLPTLLKSNFIQVLELGGCGFVGNIPDEIFYPSLIKLSLQNNELTGPISYGVANMNNLQILYLDNNKLGGAIPSNMNRMESLQVLTLNSNYFGGVFNLCHLTETLLAVDITNNPDFSCYSNCWVGEAALETANLANCNYCPVSQYTQSVLINSRWPDEGVMNICMSCPSGKYSFQEGAQGADSCHMCDNPTNPFEEINPQCRPVIQEATEVVVGGGAFGVLSFLFCFSMAGVAFFLAVLVYRARNNSLFTVRVHYLTVVLKLTLYSFVIFSDYCLAVALLCSFLYTKFGAVILFTRMWHIVISLYILIKAYRLMPYDPKEEEKEKFIEKTEEGTDGNTRSSYFMPPNTYAELIDQDAITEPKTVGVFGILAIACLFESQLLQLMPWRYSRFTAEHQGFPDASTYGFLAIVKFIQTSTCIICMMSYLADTGTYYNTSGIEALFALNITISTLLLVYSSFIEPVVCKLGSTANELTKEEKEAAVASHAAAQEVAGGASASGNRFAPRKSVLVNAADVYGNHEEELGMGAMNPMAQNPMSDGGAGNKGELPPAPHSPPPHIPNLGKSTSSALSKPSKKDEKDKKHHTSLKKEGLSEDISTSKSSAKKFVPPGKSVTVAPPAPTSAAPPVPTNGPGPGPPTRPALGVAPPSPVRGAPPPPNASDNLDRWRKMLALNIPADAVRAKMTQDGRSAAEIASVLGAEESPRAPLMRGGPPPPGRGPLPRGPPGPPGRPGPPPPGR